VEKAAQATSVSSLPSKSGGVEPPRLVSATRSLVNEGFSKGVIDRVTRPRKPSSDKCYKGKFGVYARWCDSQNFDPNKPTLVRITNFLLYMFEEHGSQYQTLTGYRSMLSSTFKHDKLPFDISHNEVISDLLRSFKVQRPPGRSKVPEWDLALVLYSLARSPFENIKNPAQVSLKHLTWKTLFLVLLASGARRGEVHALDYSKMQFNENRSMVTLRTHHDFIPKMGLTRQHCLTDIIIPGLCAQLSKDKVDQRALCPVRSLCAYQDRTRSLRGPDKKLVFVSLDEDKKDDISPSTISGWIRDLIDHVYEHPTEWACGKSGNKTHDIRGLAHTVSFKGNVSIENIVRAGSWKTDSTFFRSYLKDLSMKDVSNLKRLGPIVAGQHVINL
jgi:integrase